MSDQKTIELDNGEIPARRIVINHGTRVLVVPYGTPSGLKEIRYSASGRYTPDGIEIWACTPQPQQGWNLIPVEPDDL